MGTAVDTVICEKCRYIDAISEYKYKTGEEYILCPRCGWELRYEIVIGNDGKFVLDENDKWTYRTYEHFVSGIFCQAQTVGDRIFSQIGAIYGPVTESIVSDFEERFSSPAPAGAFPRALLSCWLAKRDEATGLMVPVIGCPPWALAIGPNST